MASSKISSTPRATPENFDLRGSTAEDFLAACEEMAQMEASMAALRAAGSMALLAKAFADHPFVEYAGVFPGIGSGYGTEFSHSACARNSEGHIRPLNYGTPIFSKNEARSRRRAWTTTRPRRRGPTSTAPSR